MYESALGMKKEGLFFVVVRISTRNIKNGWNVCRIPPVLLLYEDFLVYQTIP